MGKKHSLKFIIFDLWTQKLSNDRVEEKETKTLNKNKKKKKKKTTNNEQVKLISMLTIFDLLICIM